MKKFLHKFFIFFCGLILGIILTFNTLGLILGNIMYMELSNPQLNINLTSIVNHSQDLTRIHKYQQENPNAQQIALYTPYGDNSQELTATFVTNNLQTKKTIILIHGLYQNRSMCINYIDMYKKLGFNVLLIDLRGHGESDGIITWGQTEIRDIDMWCDYLRNTKHQELIGIHGISLGGAFSLLHSGLSLQPADFYIEDSSYGDLKNLYYNHLHSMIQLPTNSKILDVLWFYSQICMYWHTGSTLDKLSPIHAVQYSKSPILFLHGDKDTLIPPSTLEDLYMSCNSTKALYMFKNSTHAQAITDCPDEYFSTIKEFLTTNRLTTIRK